MPKYLYKQCCVCKHIIKAIVEDDRIIQLDGARPLRILARPKGFTYTDSNKTVVCTTPREVTGIFDMKHTVHCGVSMIISKFKEMK